MQQQQTDLAVNPFEQRQGDNTLMQLLYAHSSCASAAFYCSEGDHFQSFDPYPWIKNHLETFPGWTLTHTRLPPLEQL